jgi:hypothetical protein
MVTLTEKADPAIARQIIERLAEDPDHRAACLTLLAEGIEYAHGIGGQCWAVTLTKRFVRLNVGKVEVFAIFHGDVHYVLDRSKVPARYGLGDYPDHYASIPGSVLLDVPMESLALHQDALRSAWLAAIKSATRSAAKCIYRNSHSLGVLEYLRSMGFRSVPNTLGAT